MVPNMFVEMPMESQPVMVTEKPDKGGNSTDLTQSINQAPKVNRFVQPNSTEEVESLTDGCQAKVTITQTHWAVKIFRGESIFFG